MIDVITQKPLRVSLGGPTRAYLTVAFVDQLDKVTALLDANNVPFRVDEEVLSVDDGPEEALIYFEKPADPVMIQRLLDSIP